MARKYVYKKQSVRTAMALYDTWGHLTRRKRQPAIELTPKHICCVVLHQIGDVVMATSTIEAIHKMAPDVKLSIIVGKAPAPLLKYNPWGAEVHVFDAVWQHVVRKLGDHEDNRAKEKAAKETFCQLIEELAPDAVVVFHPDLVVNQLLNKLPVPYTFSFLNAGGGFHVTHPLNMPESGHQVERNYVLAETVAKTFGWQLPKLEPPHLTVEQGIIDEVKTILHQEKISTKKLVVLHPFASAETKNWPVAHWAHLITDLKAAGLEPVIVGGPHDALQSHNDDEQAVFAATPSLCGKLNLIQSAGLLTLATLFIGIDSGPAHIAAAVGTPIISIYSSVNDPDRWHPYGANNKTIILHEPVTDRKRFPYELRDIPTGVVGNPYSDKITPAMVMQAVRKLVK